jgi:hypothetical protein
MSGHSPLDTILELRLVETSLGECRLQALKGLIPFGVANPQ